MKRAAPGTALLSEIAALKAFDGQGAAYLLDADPHQGTLLLERLRPGRPLSEITDDAKATSIAAQLMRQLWKAAPAEYPFPTVRDWADGLKTMRDRFGGGAGPLPNALVIKAETLFQELIDSMTESALLHGDLHHYNILSAERQPWLAIDPKGMIGEPAYEAGAFMRNPMPQLLEDRQLKRTLLRRADQFAEELGFDRQRIIDWAMAQAVLAAWWSYEDDGEGWEPWIACAETLSALK